MKKIVLCMTIMVASALAVLAGEPAGKEITQVAAPCTEFYRDNEFNITLYGFHIFTGEDWEDDEYIQSDHFWGAGGDLKYFFHRYFGLGVEGWVGNARRFVPDFSRVGSVFSNNSTFDEDRAIGAVKGTVTFRYPLSRCSPFAPYIYGGIGVISGGGEFETLEFSPNENFFTVHHESEAEMFGQVGAGFEYRFSPHIGVMNDFSWNFVARENSDFGMIRAGLNFAF